MTNWTVVEPSTGQLGEPEFIQSAVQSDIGYDVDLDQIDGVTSLAITRLPDVGAGHKLLMYAVVISLGDLATVALPGWTERVTGDPFNNATWWDRVVIEAEPATYLMTVEEPSGIFIHQLEFEGVSDWLLTGEFNSGGEGISNPAVATGVDIVEPSLMVAWWLAAGIIDLEDFVLPAGWQLGSYSAVDLSETEYTLLTCYLFTDELGPTGDVELEMGQETGWLSQIMVYSTVGVVIDIWTKVEDL